MWTRRHMLQASALGTLAPAWLHAADNTSNQPFLVTPYVQLGNAPRHAPQESLLVLWHAGLDSVHWRVEFRAAGTSDWIRCDRVIRTEIALPGLERFGVYEVELRPLPPGSRAEYRVWLNDQAVFQAQAAVRSPSRQPFRCVVMGDVGTGSPQQKQVALQVHRYQPEFLLIPGDFVYNNGRVSEYTTNFFPVYTATEAASDRGAPLLSQCCFLGGRGQHDTEASLATHPDGHAWFYYWSFPLNGPSLSAERRHVYPLSGQTSQQSAFKSAAGARFPQMASYSFDWGNSHWVVLDTWNPHIDWTDPELRAWLQADLKQAQDATWKIVVSYLPPFQSSTQYPQGQKMRVIVDLLEAAGVDLVFSGYAHSYQRTYPLRFVPAPRPAGPVTDPGHLVPGQFTYDQRFDGREHTQADGIIYIVSGCGGNPQLHSPEQTDNPQTWQPFTVRYNASQHQFTALDLHGPRLKLQQISREGAVLDELTLTKPSAPAN
ncbi:MAG: metallophosphoesterase [Planctomycetes bacterium]|nr:metallophosphoesterase [Planctomycetota bacterium]